MLRLVWATSGVCLKVIQNRNHRENLSQDLSCTPCFTLVLNAEYNFSSFVSVFPGFIQVHIFKAFITFLPSMRQRLDSLKKPQKIKILLKRKSAKQIAVICVSSHSAFFWNSMRTRFSNNVTWHGYHLSCKICAKLHSLRSLPYILQIPKEEGRA